MHAHMYTPMIFANKIEARSGHELLVLGFGVLHSTQQGGEGRGGAGLPGGCSLPAKGPAKTWTRAAAARPIGAAGKGRPEPRERRETDEREGGRRKERERVGEPREG